MDAAGISLENGAHSSSQENPEPVPLQSVTFSRTQKTLILAIATCTALSTFVASDIYLPLLPSLSVELGASIGMVNLTVTFFMLVFAVSPLLFAGLSDAKGRKPSYTLAILIYVAANVALAAAPAHYASFLVLRIIQGFGAAAQYSLGAATVADVFEHGQRARAISVFNLGPQLGPILGPTIGGAIAQRAGWRWIFWFLVIFSGTCLLMIIVVVPETLPSRVRAKDGKPRLQWPPYRRRRIHLNSSHLSDPLNCRQVLLGLLKHPIVMISVVNTALIFGSYFCLAVSFPTLLQDKYGFNTLETGLAFLAPGAGMACGSISCGLLSDRSREGQQQVNQVSSPEIHPEQRLRPQIFGTLLFPVGVLLYAWLGDTGIHVSGVIVAMAICAFAVSWTISTNTTYLTLIRPRQVATAVALSDLLINPSAAIGTAIIAPLVNAEGFGWCFTGIALVCLVCPALATLSLIKGPKWRSKMEENKPESS